MGGRPIYMLHSTRVKAYRCGAPTPYARARASGVTKTPTAVSRVRQGAHLLRLVRKRGLKGREGEDFLGEPLGGDLAVAFLDFDADGAPAQVLRRAERGPAAHEGVKNCSGLFTEKQNKFSNKGFRLRCRVFVWEGTILIFAMRKDSYAPP